MSSHRSPYSIPIAFASFGRRLAAVHSREGVHLQTVQISLFIEKKIRTAVYIEFQCMERTDSQIAHPTVDLFRNVCGAYFQSRVCLVFVCVIKETCLGMISIGGSASPSMTPQGEFSSSDILPR